MSKRNQDLVGCRYGKLTVIRKGEDYISSKSGKHASRWICLCDCQANQKEKKYILVRQNSLKSGSTISCGCEHARVVSESNKKTKTKTNKFDLEGDFGVGFMSNDRYFLFDKDDFSKIKNHYWRFDAKGYVYTIIDDEYVWLHRLVMNAPKDKDVDHIHHQLYDCRKSQLRITAHADNMKNMLKKTNNTSGFTGVGRKDDMWRAYIGLNGKYIHLGYFKKIEDAIASRKNAELRYFGEYRNTD